MDASAGAQPAAGSYVVLAPADEGDAGAESRVILRPEGEGGAGAQELDGSPPPSSAIASDRRLVLDFARELAQDKAVQNAVLRGLPRFMGRTGGGEGKDDGEVDTMASSAGGWTLPSSIGSEVKHDDLESLPSSLDEPLGDEGLAFFSDKWCFRREDFYLDKLETETFPPEQRPGESLREESITELLDRMERDLERKEHELRHTRTENGRLRERLRQAGIHVPEVAIPAPPSQKHASPDAADAPPPPPRNLEDFARKALEIVIIVIAMGTVISRLGRTSTRAAEAAAHAWRLVQSVLG